MSQEKTNSEVLVPQYKTVIIAGTKYEVKPYAIKDIMHFSRDLVEALVHFKEKYPTLAFKEEDFLLFMPIMLDEAPRLFEMMARSIGKDGTWIQEQHDLAGISELFSIIAEINDFGVIISNFKAGWSKLQKQTIRASAEQ